MGDGIMGQRCVGRRHGTGVEWLKIILRLFVVI